MINRIKDLAAHFDLSPTAFADRIEVARPVISHIFSARNRPSLEVIQKIGLAFPAVNFEWLLYGKGEMLKSLVKDPGHTPKENATVSERKVIDRVIEGSDQTDFNPNQDIKGASLKAGFIPQKNIVKVLFFYEDNTFEEFKQSK